MGTLHYLGCVDCLEYIELGKAYDIGSHGLSDESVSNHLEYIYSEHARYALAEHDVDFIGRHLSVMSRICCFLREHLRVDKPHKIVWFTENDVEWMMLFDLEWRGM